MVISPHRRRRDEVREALRTSCHGPYEVGEGESILLAEAFSHAQWPACWILADSELFREETPNRVREVIASWSQSATVTIFSTGGGESADIAGVPVRHLNSLRGRELLRTLGKVLKKAGLPEATAPPESPRATAGSAETHHSGERYRRIVEDTPEAVCRFLPDGVILYANAPFCSLFLPGHAAPSGKDLFSLLPGDVSKHLADLLSTLSPAEATGHIEFEIERPANDIIWLEWVIHALFDEGGRLFACQSTAHDITAHRKLETELRQANSRMAFLLSASNAMIFTCLPEEDLRMVYISSNVERLLGYRQEDVVGVRGFLREKLHPDSRAHLEELLQSLQEFRHGTSELQLLHQRGNYVWIAIELRYIEGPGGGHMEAIGTMADVTARQQAEQALRQASRMEAASMLAGGIAHSLNNLMVGVIGHAELLKEEMTLRPKAREELESITQSATRAGELARQLLAFARGGKYWPRVVDLNEIVSETLRFQASRSDTTLELVQDLEAGICPVHADPSQMSQVILNLWMNAYEALPGHGTIRVLTRNITPETGTAGIPAEAASGRWVRLAVEDNGCGMDENTRRRMFDPFFTTKLQGRGLGLAAVFGIVENHNGRIAVTSRPGKGTRIDIYLPAIES